MKLTPWYRGTVKPVRVGVYARKYGPGEVYFGYWNGKHWGSGALTPQDAVRWKHWQCSFDALPWRGVAK